MLARLLIVAIYLFLPSAAECQSSWRIDRLGVTEGLSQGYIYAIHQDSKGFIWIGTHGGLNRYDGYGFKVFQYMPFNPSSLGDNSVFFIREDTNTRKFWIGGSSYLNEFDPETFSNTRYRYAERDVEYADGIFVSQHELLLACEYDVLLFNTQKKQFQHVTVLDESNQPISISRVENISTDKKGNFMVMTKTGVFFFDPRTKSCKRKTETSPDFSPFYQFEVFNVAEDNKGHYWIATNKKGLIRYDDQTKKILSIPLPQGLKQEAIRFDVVTEDSKGKIWAGSTMGLFRIDPVTLALEYFASDKNNSTSLSHSEINVIKEDRNQFMWIGTVGGGINKMIPQSTGFRNAIISGNTNENNSGTYIMGLQQVNNDVWFVNIWDQIGKLDLATGKTTMLGKTLASSGYSWYSEGTILKNRENTPVVLNGEKLYEIKSRPDGNISLHTRPAPGLFYIHYSKNGRIYYMVKTGIEKTVCINDTIYGNHFFYEAEDDESGNIWIGTSKGLLQLNTGTNNIKQFRHNDKDVKSISSDFIYSIEIDKQNEQLWMAAYKGGLCSYNFKSGSFRHYDKDDGLADNIVTALEKDDNGNLWISTNSGISSYHITDKIFRNYGLSDGLLNHEFNRQASFKNPEGWIFFGGIYGIDYFHPDSIQKNQTEQELVFTGFKAFNKDLVADNSGTIPEITLKHDENYFSIEFAALNYNDQKKIQYAYKLDESNEWIKLGNQHFLSFSDLAVGNHQLTIRSTNEEGSWLNNEIKCVINIQPAWWQTVWFRIIVIAGLVAIAVMLIRAYYRRKFEKQKQALEKQQAVEKERTRIAADMHDDLGSGLSAIRFLSEKVKRNSFSNVTIEDIDKMQFHSNELLEKMNEIIWAMNERNDSLEDLLFYTRYYIQEYCEENSLNCTIQLPESIPQLFVSGEMRRNVFLTVKESLHNIVKHAQAKNVEVTMQINKSLEIRIKDDGKGLGKVNKFIGGNGLRNMQKRMDSIGGILDIENGQGVTVSVKVPLSSQVRST